MTTGSPATMSVMPMFAKINPTSPRGIMPMPIDRRSSPRTVTPSDTALLADDGRDR